VNVWMYNLVKCGEILQRICGAIDRVRVRVGVRVRFCFYRILVFYFCVHLYPHVAHANVHTSADQYIFISRCYTDGK